MRQEEQVVHLTHEELQHMIEATNRNAIVEYETRTVTPSVRERLRRQLFKGKGKTIAHDPKEVTSRAEHDRE
ncbi:UNVERIFIED_CONTAM: hypothetical protein Slati_2954200 [Sesamum latifolium]|uniref:Uncharacterized protein n=1 Tax=Sesamum latifolium TaxID=2727402 RepID=A0AAW2VDI3_9LAMI